MVDFFLTFFTFSSCFFECDLFDFFLTVFSIFLHVFLTFLSCGLWLTGFRLFLTFQFDIFLTLTFPVDFFLTFCDLFLHQGFWPYHIESCFLIVNIVKQPVFAAFPMRVSKEPARCVFRRRTPGMNEASRFGEARSSTVFQKRGRTRALGELVLDFWSPKSVP